jgi:hypothetical protein
MKNKPPTTDAQEVKRAFLRLAKKIGKRKRIRAGEFFEMLLGCIRK